MSLTEAEILGLSENVQELFVNVKVALKGAGYDADKMLEILKQVHAETVALNAQQEALKRQLRDTSKRLEVLFQKLYNLASGYIDAAMTSVDKSSPAAKNIRRLRSRIRRPNLAESPAVQPAPEKTA
jgi:uncharacterized tellurite resistance protein B-like protein